MTKQAAIWLGKVALTMLSVGAVVGAVAGVAASALYPAFADSSSFYVVVGAICGGAFVVVFGALSRGGWL